MFHYVDGNYQVIGVLVREVHQVGFAEAYPVSEPAPVEKIAAVADLFRFDIDSR